MEAGGGVGDEKGVPVIDAPPLKVELQFYKQATASKQVSAGLFDFTSASQYVPSGLPGKSTIAQIDSTLYLAQRSTFNGMELAPLPMPTVTPVSAVDGWLWVVTTASPDRQARALDALMWIMRPNIQGEFAQALGVIPSRRSALAAWGND